ncbi:hypothetical protein GCM10029964_077240 [Kibdelosporangium lantanae]
MLRNEIVVSANASDPMPRPVVADHTHGAIAGAASSPTVPSAAGAARVATSRVWLRHRRVHPGTTAIIGRPMAIDSARQPPAVVAGTPAPRRIPGSQPITRNVTVAISPKWMVRATGQANPRAEPELPRHRRHHRRRQQRARGAARAQAEGVAGGTTRQQRQHGPQHGDREARECRTGQQERGAAQNADDQGRDQARQRDGHGPVAAQAVTQPRGGPAAGADRPERQGDQDGGGEAVRGDVAERGPEAGHGRPEVQGEQEQHERVAGHRSPSAVR